MHDTDGVSQQISLKFGAKVCCGVGKAHNREVITQIDNR